MEGELYIGFKEKKKGQTFAWFCFQEAGCAHPWKHTDSLGITCTRQYQCLPAQAALICFYHISCVIDLPKASTQPLLKMQREEVVQRGSSDNIISPRRSVALPYGWWFALSGLWLSRVANCWLSGWVITKLFPFLAFAFAPAVALAEQVSG